eukprot:TCALIF_01122-PB protein Name:"Protein of unknown function" AED:0.47 eAED:1.00 QI:0/0/0/1/0/0/3/0/76
MLLSPAGRTHLSVLIGELEGLNQSQGLVHITTNGKVVDIGQADLFELTVDHSLALELRGILGGLENHNGEDEMSKE